MSTTTPSNQPAVPDPAERADRPERPDDRAAAWRRLRRMGRARMTKANLLAGVLTIALGFAIATQIQANQATGLQTLRQDELVRVLDDVTQRSQRLDAQIRDLQGQRDTLVSGANSAQAAAVLAQRRLDALAVLAGTVKASGPGIRVTISDPDAAVHATQLLDVLQELRDAGAEVIQFGSVRMVADSSLADNGGAVTADGKALTRPFVLLAIGDPATLASALNIPGGVVDTVKRVGGRATVEQVTTLTIDALHTVRTPRYAAPVPGTLPTPSGG